MTEKLISFDLKADFGVLKKPDVNEGLQPTFNILHRPALLGILGAIAGLKGYHAKGVLPEYYQQLNALSVGIEPLDHDQGNFSKTVIKYTNTVGYANKDGNLIITEQTLLSPAYRCYILLDVEEPIQELLYNRIKNGEAEYLPYIGKNECSAWWDVEEVKEYSFTKDYPNKAYPVATMFQRKGRAVIDRQKEQEQKQQDNFAFFDLSPKVDTFLYFERLPVDFDEYFFQYRLEEFAFVNFELQPNNSFDNLYFLKQEQKYVVLF